MRYLISRILCCGALMLLPSLVFATINLVTVSTSNGVDVGTSTPITVTLTNTNTLYPLAINAIANFTANISLHASITTNTCNGATLAANTGTCTFIVTFNNPSTQGIGAFSFSLNAEGRVYPEVYSEPMAVFKEYALDDDGAGPEGIVADNNGVIWFNEIGGLGRVDDNALFECTTGSLSAPPSYPSLVLGPDQATLWFISKGEGPAFPLYLTSMSTTPFATEDECPDLNIYTPLLGTTTVFKLPIGMVENTGGNALWIANFASGITPGTATNGASLLTVANTDPETVVANYGYTNPTSFSATMNPWGITTDSNGNIWFTDRGTGSIGKLLIAPPNTVTEYPVPGVSPNSLSFIIKDNASNFWFTEYADCKIGMMTSTGVMTQYAVPTTDPDFCRPSGIAIDSGTNIWFTNEMENKIGTFNTKACTATSCSMTEYDLPPRTGYYDPHPYEITVDPNNNSYIWFTETYAGKIGELVTTALP